MTASLARNRARTLLLRHFPLAGQRMCRDGSDSVLLVNVQLDRSSLVSGFSTDHPAMSSRGQVQPPPFRAHRQAPEPRRPQRHVARIKTSYLGDMLAAAQEDMSAHLVKVLGSPSGLRAGVIAALSP